MLIQVPEEIADALSLDYALFVRRGLQVVAVLVLAVVLNRLLRMLSRRIELSVEDRDTGEFAVVQRARTLAQLLNSVGGAVIVIGAGLMILNFFFPIGPLLAGVGVAGLAVSFGAQSLVKDVISGFFILMENQYSVGDIVKVGDVGGVVERMTMRVVMVRDVQGVLHIVPNGSITRVSNMTRGWGRSVIDLGVSHQNDVDTVIEVMREVGSGLWDDPAWRPRLMEPPAVWGVEALAESGMVVRIIANTMPGKQWDVSRELRRRLKKRLDAEGIAVAIPQRMMRLDDDTRSLLETMGPERPATGSGAR